MNTPHLIKWGWNRQHSPCDSYWKWFASDSPDPSPEGHVESRARPTVALEVRKRIRLASWEARGLELAVAVDGHLLFLSFNGIFSLWGPLLFCSNPAVGMSLSITSPYPIPRPLRWACEPALANHSFCLPDLKTRILSQTHPFWATRTRGVYVFYEGVWRAGAATSAIFFFYPVESAVCLKGTRRELESAILEKGAWGGEPQSPFMSLPMAALALNFWA